MPYDALEELPNNVRDVLPRHAQTIYMEAYNSAWDQYEKHDDGRWRQKD